MIATHVSCRALETLALGNSWHQGESGIPQVCSGSCWLGTCAPLQALP